MGGRTRRFCHKTFLGCRDNPLYYIHCNSPSPQSVFPWLWRWGGKGASKWPKKGEDRRRLKERGVYSHYCNKLNKTNMLSAKTSRELRNSGICDPSINTSTRYKSLFQIPTSLSESSLRVIVLSSLVYSYFKLDLWQDEMRKVLLIRQVTEWIEWFCSFLLIPSILE